MSPLLLGELACLSAALCWAFSVSFFQRAIREHGGVAVNLGKNLISTLMLGLGVLIFGQLGAVLDAPWQALGWIAFSGLLGLTLGDSAQFLAVAHLGPHRTLVFQTFSPIFAALMAFGLYGEVLSARQLGGALAVLGGVLLVVWPRQRGPQALSLVGVLLALTSAFGQAAGVVAVKPVAHALPTLALGWVRMACAVVGLVVVLALRRQLVSSLKPLVSPSAARALVPPSLLGATCGFSLMMFGVAHAPAAISTVLLATTPIFALFVDSWRGDAKISPRALAGTALAVAGVALLTWPSS
jgi:drug/metabolite transporter (DMT)-like permease